MKFENERSGTQDSGFCHTALWFKRSRKSLTEYTTVIIQTFERKREFIPVPYEKREFNLVPFRKREFIPVQ